MSDGNKPATKDDVRTAVEELAEITNKAFIQTEKKMATKDDLKQLATKDDVSDLKENAASLKQGQQSLKKDVTSLKQGQEAMLGILDENNQLLKEIRRLPERVERLERSVFRR